VPEPPLRQLALWAAGLVAIAVLGLLLLRHHAAAPSAAASAPVPIRVQDDTGGRVLVHVAGAVRKPGVYSLRAGARVADAVKRAGGARRGADLSAVNLAAKLEDGRQILLPKRVAGGVAAAVSGTASGTAPAQPIDLNTATLEQLDALDGVGPVTAQKIIDFRSQHGGFSSIDELGQISGIGEKRLAALRNHVHV
jgi:competence protein ComEA